MSITCGIDPGKDGALVLLDGDQLLDWALTRDLVGDLAWGAAAPVIAARLRGVTADHRPRLAVLELYAGRPGEGGGSTLTIGAGWGVWRGVLAGLGVETITPAASAWTRAMLRDVQGDGKDRAVSVAMARVPGLDLAPGRRRKPHTGLADACCLAIYGQAHLAGRR